LQKEKESKKNPLRSWEKAELAVLFASPILIVGNGALGEVVIWLIGERMLPLYKIIEKQFKKC
jgi:hypothetical protein